MPVIVLAGEEEFLLSRRIAELKSTLLSPPWHTINFIKVHVSDNSTWLEAASTVPFGQGNRIVLVENCDLFTKKRHKGDKTDKAENTTANPIADDLELALTSIPDTTYLLFQCPYNFDSTLKTSKLITKYANIEEFTKEKYFPGSRHPKLESWCRQEAKKHGITIDDAAIQYLLIGTEANLRQIAAEIEKISTAILPKKTITYEIVLEHSSSQGHIFQFIDLWLNGDIAKAMDNLRYLLAQQNIMPVLATMQTMLSKWIKLKSLYDRYKDAKKVAAELRLMPFSVEKDLRRLQKYTTSSLVDKRLQLTRLEYAIKIGQIPGEHALMIFVSSP